MIRKSLFSIRTKNFSTVASGFSIIASAFSLISLSACNGSANAGTSPFTQAASPSNSTSSTLESTSSSSSPTSTNTTSTETTPTAPRAYKIGALIYQGAATAFGDVEAITSILDSHKVDYKVVDSAGMDALKLEDYNQYGMIIWPGGYAGQMSSSLKASTRETLRRAVNELGLSYVGFCAGAFIAVSPDTSWGFSMIKADTLPYYHLEDEGTDSAMTDILLADGSTRSMVWWGGPYLPEYPKGVIGRYSDTKQPAIAQTRAGKGLMILSAVHPESPQNWRDKLGLTDKDGLDQDFAWSMFDAALKQQPMKTLN